jgi:hypothetical protein
MFAVSFGQLEDWAPNHPTAESNSDNDDWAKYEYESPNMSNDPAADDWKKYGYEAACPDGHHDDGFGVKVDKFGVPIPSFPTTCNTTPTSSCTFRSSSSSNRGDGGGGGGEAEQRSSRSNRRRQSMEDYKPTDFDAAPGEVVIVPHSGGDAEVLSDERGMFGSVHVGSTSDHFRRAMRRNSIDAAMKRASRRKSNDFDADEASTFTTKSSTTAKFPTPPDAPTSGSPMTLLVKANPHPPPRRHMMFRRANSVDEIILSPRKEQLSKKQQQQKDDEPTNNPTLRQRMARRSSVGPVELSGSRFGATSGGIESAIPFSLIEQQQQQQPPAQQRNCRPMGRRGSLTTRERYFPPNNKVNSNGDNQNFSDFFSAAAARGRGRGGQEDDQDTVFTAPVVGGGGGGGTRPSRYSSQSRLTRRRGSVGGCSSSASVGGGGGEVSSSTNTDTYILPLSEKPRSSPLSKSSRTKRRSTSRERWRSKSSTRSNGSRSPSPQSSKSSSRKDSISNNNTSIKDSSSSTSTSRSRSKCRERSDPIANQNASVSPEQKLPHQEPPRRARRRNSLGVDNSYQHPSPPPVPKESDHYQHPSKSSRASKPHRPSGSRVFRRGSMGGAGEVVESTVTVAPTLERRRRAMRRASTDGSSTTSRHHHQEEEEDGAWTKLDHNMMGFPTSKDASSLAHWGASGDTISGGDGFGPLSWDATPTTNYAMFPGINGKSNTSRNEKQQRAVATAWMEQQ